MGVSKNRGTPKWMVKIMKNPIKMDDLGAPHYFWKHPYIIHLKSKHPLGRIMTPEIFIWIYITHQKKQRASRVEEASNFLLGSVDPKVSPPQEKTHGFMVGFDDWETINNQVSTQGRFIW